MDKTPCSAPAPDHRCISPKTFSSSDTETTFSMGESWEKERQTTAGACLPLPLARPQRLCPSPLLQRKSASLALLHCPRPSEAPQPHCPFLFTLGDELLQSLSALLALLFVLKSSYDFAPGFIANSMYLSLCPGSQHKSFRAALPTEDKCQLTQERKGVDRYGGGRHKGQGCPQAGSMGESHITQG